MMDIKYGFQNNFSNRDPMFFFELFINDEFYCFVTKESKNYYFEKLDSSKSNKRTFVKEGDSDESDFQEVDSKFKL